MTKRKNESIDDEPEYIRIIRKDAKAKYCVSSRQGNNDDADSDEKLNRKMDKIKVATSRKTKPKAQKIEEFVIDNLNLNIIGDVEAIETKPRVPEDAESVRRRLKEKMDMYDEMPTDSSILGANDTPDSEAQLDKATDTTIMTDTVITNEVSEACKEDENVNQSLEVEKETPPKATSSPQAVKPTRISAKMRRATRDELHDSYLVKTSTKDDSPITIAPDLIKAAYRICAVSGDHKARQTYLINNLLPEILKALEPDI